MTYEEKNASFRLTGRVQLILLASPHDQIHQKPSKYGIGDQLCLDHKYVEAITETSLIKNNTLPVEDVSHISNNSCLIALKHKSFFKAFKNLVHNKWLNGESTLIVIFPKAEQFKKITFQQQVNIFSSCFIWAFGRFLGTFYPKSPRRSKPHLQKCSFKFPRKYSHPELWLLG